MLVKTIKKANAVRNTEDESISSGVKVAVQNLQKIIPVDSAKITNIVVEVFSQEGIKKPAEITICFLNDTEIKKLNLRYLGRNNPTDVIAFDLAEHKLQDKYFADIVISSDRAVYNAKVFKTSPVFELYLYVIHGVLHILGYDDKTQRQRNIMNGKANRILKYVIRNS